MQLRQEQKIYFLLYLSFCKELMDVKLPPLTALHYFTSAAKHLSFSQAAKELYVSEGAISRQMKLLADYYGKALFQKNGRGIMLTAKGQLLLSVAQPALEEVAAVSAQLQASSAQLTINVTTSFAIRWLLPRLAKFERLHPQIDVQLQASSSEESTRDKLFDIQISYQLQPSEVLCKYRRKLLDESLLVVCSPSYLEGGEIIPLSELHTKKLLLNELTGRDWRWWGELLDLAPLPIESALKFEQDDVAIQTAVAGLGIALANVAYIERELSMGSLVPATALPAVVVGAHYVNLNPISAQSAPVQAFTTWLMIKVEKLAE